MFTELFLLLLSNFPGLWGRLKNLSSKFAGLPAEKYKTKGQTSTVLSCLNSFIYVCCIDFK